MIANIIEWHQKVLNKFLTKIRHLLFNNKKESQELSARIKWHRRLIKVDLANFWSQYWIQARKNNKLSSLLTFSTMLLFLSRSMLVIKIWIKKSQLIWINKNKIKFLMISLRNQRDKLTMITPNFKWRRQSTIMICIQKSLCRKMS